jgi:hypothetical protein
MIDVNDHQHEAMRTPKRDHDSVTQKKQKGPRPTSQHSVIENLVTMQEEVRKATARAI